MSSTTISKEQAAARVPSPPLNYDYSVITSDTDPAATLLLDAKNEYNKQLVSHLRQPIFNLMKTIYNTSEDICHQENTPENVLMVFQDNLAQVPKWSKTRRTKEYDEFLKISKCDWFNELIKFCYITHVKILTIVNKPRPDVKLSISIPSGGAFFHSVCVSVARELWRSPFLFNKNVGGKYEYQKNMRQIEQIIDNSVDTCIRAHIPMKAILHEYLSDDVSVAAHADSSPVVSSSNITAEKPIPVISPETLKTDHKTLEPLTTDTKTAARTTKPGKMVISDELDDFLDTPLANQIPLITNEDMTDIEEGLETVQFSKSDEMVDELEIIEPTIDDDTIITSSNPATPISMINEDVELSGITEVVIETKQQQQKQTEEPDNTTNITKNEPLNESINETSNQIIENNTREPEIETEKPGAKNEININNMKISEQKPINIEEFDIDSLPEISLSALTQMAEPNKPTTPEPIDNKTELISTIQQTSPEIKHIPLSDINEPGQPQLQTPPIIQQELKQPMPKKKIIVEDLGIDDLDEVPLAAKVEEMRTFKNQNTVAKTSSSQNIKDFAFF